LIVGIGIDIVELIRIKVVLDRYGERFYRRIYTQRERRELKSEQTAEKNENISSDKRIIRKAAGKFAAKEAFLKAVGTGLSEGIAWRDVELLTEKSGAPRIILHGKAAEIAKRRNASFFHVSISHSKSNAVAFVIIEGSDNCDLGQNGIGRMK